eukprot:SAG31_NODE_28085_length_415_cov_1.617089_1_plen_58_part_10
MACSRHGRDARARSPCSLRPSRSDFHRFSAPRHFKNMLMSFCVDFVYRGCWAVRAGAA